MNRRIVILTEGHSNPHSAKTGCSIIRYRGSEVEAILDSTQVGRSPLEILGVGEQLQFVANLDDVPEANTLLIGIAPTGGKIPAAWRSIILQAISRGMDVISGLHMFLTDDPEFCRAAGHARCGTGRCSQKLMFARSRGECHSTIPASAY